MTPKQTRPTAPRKFPWKWLFLILLALNLALGLFIARRITARPEPHLAAQIASATQTKKVAHITATTPQLNALINGYLKAHQSATTHYQFYLSDHNAVLVVDYRLFGTSIPMTIYFQPAATATGDVVLSVQSIAAGTLTIPPTAALGYVASMQLPPFVSVNEKSSSIKLSLKQLDIDGLHAQADNIDMAQGKYSFDIYQK